MRRLALPILRYGVALALLAASATPVAGADAMRGRYIFDMAGCAACHTAPKGGAFLAGGRRLETPFGTFLTPNITPHPTAGIGGWLDDEFEAAMRDGRSPAGDHYYPSFPYTSYTRMRRADILDLKAYLDTVAPVDNAVPGHELSFPFRIRALNYLWKQLFFTAGEWQPPPARDAIWNRGAYIVNGAGHCAECHTPRGLLGNLDRGRAFAGTKTGPDGKPVPNITTHATRGIGDWAADDIVFALETGLLPDGDSLGGVMAEVVEHTTSKLTADDLAAIAIYLGSLPPRE